MEEGLGRLMSGDEESPKVPEPLKVGLTTFFKLVSQAIQVSNTIFNDPDSLGIKPLWAIEKIYHASADHRIQCHQWALMLASYLRPALLLVSFPEGQHGLSIHSEVPYNLGVIAQGSTLAHRVIGSQAFRT